MRRIGALYVPSRRRSGMDRLSVTAFPAGVCRVLAGTRAATFSIDHRWGGGDLDRVSPATLTELVALSAGRHPGAAAARHLAALQSVTRTVPIVFVSVSDPVGAGYVASLARPGANTTGFSLFEYGTSGKWLELLKQIVPVHDASGCDSRSVDNLRNRPVRCNPGGGTVIRGGVDARRCA